MGGAIKRALVQGLGGRNAPLVATNPNRMGWVSDVPSTDPCMDSIPRASWENRDGLCGIEIRGIQGVIRLEPPRFEPRFPPRNQITQKAYDKLTHTLLKKQREAYHEEVEDYYRAAGWRPTPEKRELVHFDWLARRLLGESCVSILGPKRKLSHSVAKATRALARFLGLEIPAYKSKNPI
jgi:hypothetical protein